MTSRGGAGPASTLTCAPGGQLAARPPGPSRFFTVHLAGRRGACRPQPSTTRLIVVLPAQFAQPPVIDAEVVRDLVDDGPADLLGDLLLSPAGRADRPAMVIWSGSTLAYPVVLLVSGTPW